MSSMAKKQTDGVLRWAKEQRKTWQHAIRLMEAGKMGTSEVRGGRIVDTTTETIAAYSKLCAELNGLIYRHETRNA